jgi:hypothetical protein
MVVMKESPHIGMLLSIMDRICMHIVKGFHIGDKLALCMAKDQNSMLLVIPLAYTGVYM